MALRVTVPCLVLARSQPPLLLRQSPGSEWGASEAGSRSICRLPAVPRPGHVRLTVHVAGHLAEHGQVGLIDDRAEDPPPAMLILPEDPLPGHAEGHHPHGKEEQEEEHVYQLSWEDTRVESGLHQGGLSTPLTTEKDRGSGTLEPKVPSI